ncbi:hypothetical protein L2E82_00388 [Cichorium intybus]|uniref:Uncharacterized protein n=1 Tax=Cichorium intybus TaxID=13427 RepID=A0ACB9GX11_CICIN|nr:hypothetical protein L2E82_00388 [Cichorium intybus]
MQGPKCMEFLKLLTRLVRMMCYPPRAIDAAYLELMQVVRVSDVGHCEIVPEAEAVTVGGAPKEVDEEVETERPRRRKRVARRV